MATVPSEPSETTSLLPEDGQGSPQQSALKNGYSAASTIENGVKTLESTPSAAAEAKLLGKYAGPLVITYLLQYSFNSTAVIVVGHLGTTELGAVSLASMTANVSGIAIFLGMATSLDTLCSQAYGGGHLKLVGLQVQRMVCFMFLMLIPIGAFWICSPWILAALVPEKDLAVLAGSYLRIYLLGAPGFAMFEAGKRFVQAQGTFTPSLVVLVICAPLNVLLNWLFVWRFHWGLPGAAFAISIANTLQPIILFLYIWFVIPSSLQCWPPLSRNIFKNWGPMIWLSIPDILMVESEWLAFEITTFSSAYLGKVHLAAQSVLYNVCTLVYHIPFPASIAASTRIGNLIGSGDLRATRKAVQTYWFIFLGIGLFSFTFLVSLKDVIPKIYSNDPEVQHMVSMVMPLIGLLQFFDATTTMCGGILRGFGRQKIGGTMNFCIYYLVCLPLAMFLTFGPPRLELYGLWTGTASGMFLLTVIMAIYIRFASWQKCVDDARGRVE